MFVIPANFTIIIIIIIIIKGYAFFCEKVVLFLFVCVCVCVCVCRIYKMGEVTCGFDFRKAFRLGFL
jgi:hypothetical protein